MKKTVILTVFLLALAAVRSDSSVGVVNNGSYSSVGVINNGAQHVHFTAEYEGLIGGNWTCAGERVRKRGPVLFTKDIEECTITDLSTLPPGTYAGNPTFTVNGVPYTWNSDYDGRQANFVTFTVTDNGDGTGHVSLVAYY
jgi:hypothetical protein